MLLSAGEGEEDGWRQAAIREHGAALGVIDTRPALDFPGAYGEDRHPSGEGNRALAEWLREEVP